MLFCLKMYRKELLDARKALRGVREGVSGPRSKKQRGEWEQNKNLLHNSTHGFLGNSEEQITLRDG